MVILCSVGKSVTVFAVFGFQIQVLPRRSLSFCFQCMTLKKMASCPRKSSLPYSGRFWCLFVFEPCREQKYFVQRFLDDNLKFEIQMILLRFNKSSEGFLLVSFPLVLCRSFIDISGSALSKSQADDGIAAMLQAAGLYNKDSFSWEDFHFLLRDHSAQLNIKG